MNNDSDADKPLPPIADDARDARADQASRAKSSFVLSLPPQLPVRDAVTLGEAKGIDLSELEVRTIRSVADATTGVRVSPNA